MDLEKSIISFLFQDSKKGFIIHKKLKEEHDHNGTASSSGHCSYELTHDERFPKPEPNEEPVEGEDYIKDEFDIVTLNGSKPLTGDYCHGKYQERLFTLPDFLAAEREFTCQEGDILEMGYIDLEIIDSRTGKRVRTIVDIKGCGENTFPYSAGARKRNIWTYTYWKRENSIIQSNEYALGRPYFGILWVNLGSWGQFKLEWINYDPEMHAMVMQKRANVKEALANGGLPKWEGNCYCELGKDGSQCYCRHHKNGTSDKNFPTKSGANCPGKTKLKQALEHPDLLDLKKELEDLEGDY